MKRDSKFKIQNWGFRSTLFVILIFNFALVSSAAAQIASGGNYALDQSIVASGGQSSAGGNYAIVGTIGQTVAGQKAVAGQFAVEAGFWQPAQFAPTAALVSVGGRITTADGSGISNVRVTMTGADGITRTVISNSFGYFRFADAAAGETYIFSAFSRRFQFGEPTVVRTILDDTDDINFVALDIVWQENSVR